MLMFSPVRIVLTIQCLKILQIVLLSFISKKRIKELEDDREEFGVCFFWCGFFFCTCLHETSMFEDGSI